MNKINKTGSATLVVLFIITIVFFYSTVRMRNASYMLDLSIQREKKEQQFGITEALLNYGIMLYTQKTTIENQKANPIVLTFQQWPLATVFSSKGILKIIPDMSEKKIQADVFQDNISICTLSCNIIEENTNLNDNPVKSNRFVIKNFQ